MKERKLPLTPNYYLAVAFAPRDVDAEPLTREEKANLPDWVQRGLDSSTDSG